MRAKIGIAVGSVAALIAISVGIWLIGHHSGSSVVPASSMPAVAPDSASGDIVDFPTFRMVIPEGWERLPEREGKDKALLFLRGPAAGAKPLVLAANVLTVAKGVTLNGFMSSYTSDWPIQEFPLTESVKLCGQKAHMLGFTNDDGDNLVLFCLYKQSAHVFVMVAPTGTMPQHINTFYSVVTQMQLYE